MKHLIFATIALLISIDSFAGTKLPQLTDDAVPAALVESVNVSTSADKKITARILSVYRGAAAGMSSLIVTILDDGPNPGDYPNLSSYEFTQITDGPKNIKLAKIDATKYGLGFDVTVVSMNPDDGNFIYTKKRIQLTIVVNKEGTVTSVEK